MTYKKSMLWFFVVVMVLQNIKGSKRKRKEVHSKEAYCENLKQKLHECFNSCVPGAQNKTLVDIVRDVIDRFTILINEEKVKNNQKEIKLEAFDEKYKRNWIVLSRKRFRSLYEKYCDMKGMSCDERLHMHSLMEKISVVLKNNVTFQQNSIVQDNKSVNKENVSQKRNTVQKRKREEARNKNISRKRARAEKNKMSIAFIVDQ
ncbi:MAG TPA: hypothetical protein VEK38_01360 [Candidatus Bathyarchaeia archaeon]|nr:hypothetical protein [Candidatus Bathyarchaeia archaeon]